MISEDMSDTILSRISKPLKTNDFKEPKKIGERTFGRWRVVVQKVFPVAGGVRFAAEVDDALDARGVYQVTRSLSP